jgi:hypothetical protein
MSQEELLFICFNFALKMAGAITALTIISLCEYVGAKMYHIELREVLDKIENDPIAYSNYSTGRFIGACIILASIIG